MNLIRTNEMKLRRIVLAVLLASFAPLETTSISAQELGRTITSPFGVANPYMNASDASESGSDGDTFVDPETGEVGHIIRNPFGQTANPEMENTDSDTFKVEDEDDEFYISLPDEIVASRNSSDRDENEKSTDDTPANNTPRGGSSSYQNLCIIPTDENIKEKEIVINSQKYYFVKEAIGTLPNTQIQYYEITVELLEKKDDNRLYEIDLNNNDTITWHLIKGTTEIQNNQNDLLISPLPGNQCRYLIPKNDYFLGKVLIIEARVNNISGQHIKTVRHRIVTPKASLQSITFYHGGTGSSILLKNAIHQEYDMVDEAGDPIMMSDPDFPPRKIPKKYNGFRFENIHSPEYIYSTNSPINDPVLYKNAFTPSVIVNIVIEPNILQDITLIDIDNSSSSDKVLDFKQDTICTRQTNGSLNCKKEARTPINSFTKKNHQIFHWLISHFYGYRLEIDLGITEHDIYVIPDIPKTPWNNFASLELVDYLLVNHNTINGETYSFDEEWVSDPTNEERHLEILTSILFYSWTGNNRKPDSATSKYFYNINTFILTKYKRDTNENHPADMELQSCDSARALSLLGKLLGINIKPRQTTSYGTGTSGPDHSFCTFSTGSNFKIYDCYLDGSDFTAPVTDLNSTDTEAANYTTHMLSNPLPIDTIQ